MAVNLDQALVVTASLALVTTAIAALTVLFLKATLFRRTTMLITRCLTTLLGGMVWTLEGGDAVVFAIAIVPFAFSVGFSLSFHWEYTEGFGRDMRMDSALPVQP